MVDYPVLLLGHSQLSVKLKKKFSASLLFIKNTKDNFLIYSSLLINYNAYIAKNQNGSELGLPIKIRIIRKLNTQRD